MTTGKRIVYHGYQAALDEAWVQVGRLRISVGADIAEHDGATAALNRVDDEAEYAALLADALATRPGLVHRPARMAFLAGLGALDHGDLCRQILIDLMIGDMVGAAIPD